MTNMRRPSSSPAPVTMPSAGVVRVKDPSPAAMLGALRRQTTELAATRQEHPALAGDGASTPATSDLCDLRDGSQD